MDDADRADLDAEIHMRASLLRRKPTLAAKGACHFCDEPTDGAALFCSAECREDHERVERIKSRN